MPELAELARQGAWCRAGAIGVVPTSTYPNHATFVTGVTPAEHGIIANELPAGEGTVPSWERGVSVPTLFDSMTAAGRRSAGVFGDHHLVGVTGATAATFHWPTDGVADNVACDVLGYAKDEETVARIGQAIDTGAELVVAQLNEPDTAAHLFGPDSDEALDRYRRTDAYLGALVESLRSEWDDWVIIVVSDHSQEEVTHPEPIDLRLEAESRGLGGLVFDDGAVAVLAGEMAQRSDWLAEVTGIESVGRLDTDTVLAFSEGGRWFSSFAYPVRGVHGTSRTEAQIAVVAGGHPGCRDLAAHLASGRPHSTWWAPAIAQLLDVDAPADLHRKDASGTS
jgi:hypothetical protein